MIASSDRPQSQSRSLDIVSRAVGAVAGTFVVLLLAAAVLRNNITGPLFVYIIIAAFMSWNLVRDNVLEWYRNQRFYTRSGGVSGLLFAHADRRISVEILAFVLSAVGGALGLWLVAAFKSRTKVMRIINVLLAVVQLSLVYLHAVTPLPFVHVAVPVAPAPVTTGNGTVDNSIN